MTEALLNLIPSQHTLRHLEGDNAVFISSEVGWLLAKAGSWGAPHRGSCLEKGLCAGTFAPKTFWGFKQKFGVSKRFLRFESKTASISLNIKQTKKKTLQIYDKRFSFVLPMIQALYATQIDIVSSQYQGTREIVEQIINTLALNISNVGLISSISFGLQLTTRECRARSNF